MWGLLTRGGIERFWLVLARWTLAEGWTIGWWEVKFLTQTSVLLLELGHSLFQSLIAKGKVDVRMK